LWKSHDLDVMKDAMPTLHNYCRNPDDDRRNIRTDSSTSVLAGSPDDDRRNICTVSFTSSLAGSPDDDRRNTSRDSSTSGLGGSLDDDRRNISTDSSTSGLAGSPDDDRRGPWCFTHHVTDQMEYCDIPRCGTLTLWLKLSSSPSSRR